MNSDLDIQRAIEDGKRNLEAKQLIHNWCQHARVEKFGGTGLIEVQTGLPIGHHAMVCDFAPASGMATWLLEEAAVHFHDAYCKDCPKRQPVGLPNISKLVDQRDRDLELARSREREARTKKETEFQDRCAVRARIRDSSPIVVSTFLDDLQAYDADRNNDAALRMIETVRLAPETLNPELAEHLFALLEGGEHWFDHVGLTILSRHASDQDRLTRCAMRCLASGHVLGLAAEIVSSRIAHVRADDIREAVQGLAYVASPPRPDFPRSETEPENAVPLLSVAAKFPEETARGIDALLGERAPFRVGLGARALISLLSTDEKWVERFLRSLAALLSKADILVDVESDSELRRVSHDLTSALTEAFLVAPGIVDAELMRHFEGASSHGEARLVGVYEHVIRRAHGGYNEEVEIENFQPYRVALTRIAALAESSENSELAQHLLSALRHPPSSLGSLAKELMDLFLGTAALLDSKLHSQPVAESTVITPESMVAAMERRNVRSNRWYYRKELVIWVVHGAGFDAQGLAAFEDILERRGSLSDSLGAAIIEEISPLLKTVTGVKAVLPYLYNAMVGPSTLARASAAEAIEEIGSHRLAELPSLVSEALFLMLMDPYVIVHKATVRALRRVNLPDSFSRSVSAALQNLIVAYRKGEDEDFLLNCIEAYGRGKRDEPNFVSETGAILLAILTEVKPSRLLQSEHVHFLRMLSEVEGYAELILGLFSHCQYDHEMEHALELARELPHGAVEGRLPMVLKAIACAPSDPVLCGTFVEILTRDGDWEGAVEVARAQEDAISDTPRERLRKLFAQQLKWRAEFEYLISQGRMDDAFSVGEAWGEAAREITEARERNEKSDPFRFVPRAPEHE